MENEKVTVESAGAIVPFLLLQEANTFWQCIELSASRPNRKPHPRDFFRADVDSRWMSREARAIQNGSAETQKEIESTMETEGQQEQNKKQAEITKKLEKITNIINERLEDPNSNVKTQKDVLNQYFPMPCMTPKNYKTRTQGVSFARSIVRAKNQNRVKRMREIYYDSQAVFDNKMEKVVEWTNKYSKIWNVHSSAFNVLPCPKGLRAGPIAYAVKDPSKLDSSQMTSSQASVVTSNGSGPDAYCEEGAYSQSQPSAMSSQLPRKVHCSATIIEDPSLDEEIVFTAPVPWLLVVEKETIFNKLRQELNELSGRTDENNSTDFGIIVTAKGFPDQATKRFLKRVRMLLPPSVPFYIIADGDAYGMHIVHDYNSIQPSEKCGSASKEMFQWIGIRPSMWRQFVGRLQEAIVDTMMQESQKCQNELHPSQMTNKNKTARLLDCTGFDHCAPIDAAEIDRALSLIEREDVSEEIKHELCKELMLGFKMEAECASHDGYISLLPKLSEIKSAQHHC